MNVKYYVLQVYTRWDIFNFRTKNLEEGWNGIYRGAGGQVSVYVYICPHTTSKGRPGVGTETVTYVR